MHARRAGRICRFKVWCVRGGFADLRRAFEARGEDLQIEGMNGGRAGRICRFKACVGGVRVRGGFAD